MYCFKALHICSIVCNLYYNVVSRCRLCEESIWAIAYENNIHHCSDVAFECMQGVQWPGKPGNVREFRCKEKKSGKSQGIFKNKKSQGKVMEFCCVKLIFSQSEHHNFENFLVEHAPRPLSTVLDTHKKLVVVWKSQEKSGNFIPSGDWTPCVCHETFIPCFLCSIAMITHEDDVILTLLNFTELRAATSQSYSHMTRSSIHKFDNDYDITFNSYKC